MTNLYICFSQREVRKKYLLKVCTIENLDKMYKKCSSNVTLFLKNTFAIMILYGSVCTESVWYSDLFSAEM